MSLRPQTPGSIPTETDRVAKAAFPQSNAYMKMRDELGVFFSDEQFAQLFSSRGQPALCPWRLALVTIMQFAENLTDRQAADAVRSRIDIKYVLGLELTDPGFNYSVLSEFRSRLIDGGTEHLLFETMLTRFVEKGLLSAYGKQRTDSTHILAAIRTLTRLELVTETLTHTLNVLATLAPDWLKSWVPADWFTKYERQLDEYRLPQEKQERTAFAQALGTDGHRLLWEIYSQNAPEHLHSIEAVETMRAIWVQQYYIEEEQVFWREKGNIPSSTVMISSPHDTDARYSSKRSTIAWVGYKMHLTETCEKDCPNLITNVQTTLATDGDSSVVEKIHQELDESLLLPAEHLASMGYGSTDLLRDSQKNYGINFICPMRPDNSWQARTEGAFDMTHFQIEWDKKKVTCPQSKSSIYWENTKWYDKRKIRVKFDNADCGSCPSKHRCTRSRLGHRELSFAPQQDFSILHKAREHQKTPEFKDRYALRAGIEGTISQIVFALGMRQCRYRGMEKTHLQQVLTACAINFKRAADWFFDKPRSQTRTSRFAALAA